jgi:hypothetical protein
MNEHGINQNWSWLKTVKFVIVARVQLTTDRVCEWVIPKLPAYFVYRVVCRFVSSMGDMSLEEAMENWLLTKTKVLGE